MTTNNMGIGAMISRLAGNEDAVAAYLRGINKRIVAARIDDDANNGDGACILSFADGELSIFDDGRSCCESRYITCDDDVSSLAGATLSSIQLRSGADDSDDYGECHETQFVIIETTNGSVTLCTHNQHNGYYGGFSIRMSWEAFA